MKFLVFILSLVVCSYAFAETSAVSQVQHGSGSSVYKSARQKISANRSSVVQKVKSYKPKVNK